MRTHAATETILAEAGVPFTAMRNGFYASATAMMMGDVAASHLVAGPADGKIAWTTHADLAAAAAEIVVAEGRFDGPTPPLTGREALDLEDLAMIAADILGAPVERRIVVDETFRAQLVARGVPDTVVELTLGFYQASRGGEFAAVDPTLGQLIGRPPEMMRDVLRKRLTD